MYTTFLTYGTCVTTLISCSMVVGPFVRVICDSYTRKCCAKCNKQVAQEQNEKDEYVSSVQFNGLLFPTIRKIT